MSGRRRRGGGHGGEFHVDERWMASYMDMVTVLMCLFIVLYAMSTVDANKFSKLKNSLATGFGVTNSKTVDTAEGIVVPKQLVDKKGQGFTASTFATNTLQFAKQLQNRIETALQSVGMASKATVTVDGRGVTIGLVGSAAYFDGNAATLRPDAMTVLHAIGPLVAEGHEAITVEGHADPHGSAGAFGSDWTLGAARATTVLQYLIDHAGVAETRISEVSYGSSRPLPGTSAGVVEHNRRVDIVLHTRTPDAGAAASSTDVAKPASAETANR